MTSALALLFLFQAAASAPSFERIAKQAAAAREQAQVEKATALYQQALKLRPAWKDGWWYLGSLLYDRDHYAEGRDAFRKLVVLDPKDAKAFVMLGLCEYRTREYEPALGHLNRARIIGLGDFDPQMSQVAVYHTAVLLTRFEHFEAAIEALLELVKQGNASPSVVEAAGLAALRKPLLPSEVPSHDRELVLLTGRAVVNAGERNPAEAQKSFEAVVAVYPKAPNVHYVYGAYLLLSDPDMGLKEMEKELEIDPGHLQALTAIAFEYVKRGEAARGREYAERAIKASPKSFVGHAALGRVLVELGSVAEGIRELEEAARLAPESPQVRISLASAYARAGRSADAARERAAFLRLKNGRGAETGAKAP